MKRLLLVAAVAAIVSQDTLGVTGNTVRVNCPAGYIYNSATGKCSKALYGNKNIGTGGQQQVGHGGTQRVAPMKANTSSNYGPNGTHQLPGSNPATWTPAMNTKNGVQKHNIGSNGKQSLMSRQAAMRRSCTQKGLNYVPVAKQAGYCSMNTSKGVRQQQNIGGNPATYAPKAVVGRNGVGTRNMTGNKAGGSY